MKKMDSHRVLIFLFLVSVFLLSLCKIEDTDAWTHLNAGRLIWELKELPVNEPFIYTTSGMSFLDSYRSWLFGLIYYLSYNFFDIYGVITLKALTVTFAFYILLKDALIPYKNSFVAIAVMTAIVMMSRYRFVERPDAFLMVYISFIIFSLNAFVYENKKYVYTLPFVHVLWANTHSSINLMIVPFLAFMVGGSLQQLLQKKGIRSSNTPSLYQLKIIFFIFIASFVSSLLSPYFISQYTWGSQFLALDWYKQEIRELLPPTWKTWKSLYILTAAVAASFIYNWLATYLRRDRELEKFYPSLIYIFLLIPFVVLAFTATRFIFLLAIVSGPIIIRNLSESPERKEGPLFSKFALAGVVIWLFLYTALTLAAIKPFGNEEKVFGFGISYEFIPEKALEYMDKRNIDGRVFNTFYWGPYIIWRDLPKRIPFADGRLVISPDLLEKMAQARYNASILKELYDKYGFESILVSYFTYNSEQPDSAIDQAISGPDWALVYWDDSSLLYLKKGGRYDRIIKEDEYKFVKPSIPGKIIGDLTAHDSDYNSSVISELKRNIRDTDSSKAHLLLGFIYNKLGLYADAIDSFSRTKDPAQIVFAYKGMAYSYANLGRMDKSINYFKMSLSISDDAGVCLDLARIYLKKGDKKLALKYLEKGFALDKNLIELYPLLINMYRDLGKEDKASRLQLRHELLKVSLEGEEYYKQGLAAYYEKKFDVAIDKFEKSIAMYPSNAKPYSSLGFIYLENGMIDKALEYFKKAIDIDSSFAVTHYGMAFAYKKKGDFINASKHFKEYLKIQPSGSLARRAKEEIASIK